MNEDLLEAALSVLKSKIDVIMLDVNNMMSNAYIEDKAAKKMANKISKLAKANRNYQQGLSLKAQMLALKITSSAQETNTDSNKNEEE